MIKIFKGFKNNQPGMMVTEKNMKGTYEGGHPPMLKSTVKFSYLK